MKPISSKQELVSLILSHRKEIQEFGVQKLGLFGSFVRNEANEASDIDLLVEMPAERKTLRNFMGLIYYLEDLTGREVQVLTPQGLSPYIGPHILKEVENVIS
jgi:uncharacterized protein